MRTFLLPLTALLLLALAGPALASDGVLEINQTCAVQTGCFAGDSPGMPVTISSPGSYRLTSNLSLFLRFGEIQNQGIVSIEADHVTLDLAGFQISCGASLGPCSGSGIGVGGRVTPRPIGTSVQNGTIEGMPAVGVRLGSLAKVTNLLVRENGESGILVGIGSIVSGNGAYLNMGDGINANAGSIVSGNTAYQNVDDGIFANPGCTVSGNTVHLNGGDGIEASISSAVQRNTALSNTGCGLRLTPSVAYRDNTILGSTCTVMGGVNAGGNVCDGTTTCP